MDSGRKQNNTRIGHVLRRKLLQRLSQQLPVVPDAANAVAAENAAQAALERAPVGQHVGHAGRHSQVVFQHFEALFGSHQVGSAQRHVHAVRGLDAAHFDAVLRAAAHQIQGRHAIGQDPARAVHVGQEQIQGLEPLLQPALDEVPLRGRDQPGQKIDWNDPLLGPLFAVHGEGDPLMQERTLGQFLHRGDVLGRHPVERFVELPAMRARARRRCRTSRRRTRGEPRSSQTIARCPQSGRGRRLLPAPRAYPDLYPPRFSAMSGPCVLHPPSGERRRQDSRRRAPGMDCASPRKGGAGRRGRGLAACAQCTMVISSISVWAPSIFSMTQSM